MLAKNLSGQPVDSTEESRLRTSISRAYYSVFNAATEKAQAKWGFDPVFGDGSHDCLIRFLLGRKENLAVRIGRDLKRMRRWRVEADYRDAVSNLASNARDAILSSERLTEWMKGP